MNAAEVRTKVGLLTALLAFITGCQVTLEQPSDRSILTDEPCPAPCWQGIVPGETTIDEAVAILDALGMDYHRFDREVQWHRGEVFFLKP